MKYEKMYIRSLNAADLDSILELQENTLLGLKDPSVLRKNSPEILLQALSERNIALGVFIDDKLIAIGIAVDPVPPETDLRVNLQKFTVDKAMDLKICIVSNTRKRKFRFLSKMRLNNKTCIFQPLKRIL